VEGARFDFLAALNSDGPKFCHKARRCDAGKCDAEYFIGICALFEQANHPTLYGKGLPGAGSRHNAKALCWISGDIECLPY
jgi:hypothetical protein